MKRWIVKERLIALRAMMEELTPKLKELDEIIYEKLDEEECLKCQGIFNDLELFNKRVRILNKQINKIIVAC